MRLPRVWSSFNMMKSEVLLMPAEARQSVQVRRRLKRGVAFTGEDLLGDLLLSFSEEEKLETRRD